jgi:glycosyltransferase involved in cell wall biosynthesis
MVKDLPLKFLLVGGLDSNPGGISKNELELSIENTNIEWIGPVQDVRPYIVKSDVFVLPSYREGIPRSTQEAMAMGKAILTTNVQGCRETVMPGINGVMITHRSAGELAKAFTYYHENRHLILEFGRESRKIAEKKFDSRVKDQTLMQILLASSV